MCAHGEKRGDAAWTARYLDLMQAIGELELRAFEGTA
jgi:hypothetical protein